jgi:hypothetical protein
LQDFALASAWTLILALLCCTLQTGVYKALVDTLNSVSFTIVGDDADLSWAVAQVSPASKAAKRLSSAASWPPVS